jgi:very-short-patch-repair endonuclease
MMAHRLARNLRKNATPAERVLWQQLRFLKTEGRHFRRQVPIAGYIADFACHHSKLVVELDCGQHNEELAIERDRARTATLERHGYRVLRFWNNDVLTALDGVVDRIRHDVRLQASLSYDQLSFGATPTPCPSPQGGGEGSTVDVLLCDREGK